MADKYTFDSSLDLITRFGYRNDDGLKKFQKQLFDDELFLKMLFCTSSQYENKDYDISIILKFLKEFNPTILMTSIDFCYLIDRVFYITLCLVPERYEIYSFFGLPLIVYNMDFYTNLSSNCLLMLKGDSEQFKSISVNFEL